MERTACSSFRSRSSLQSQTQQTYWQKQIETEAQVQKRFGQVRSVLHIPIRQ